MEFILTYKPLIYNNLSAEALSTTSIITALLNEVKYDKDQVSSSI